MNKLGITILVMTGIELLAIWHLEKEVKKHDQNMEELIRFRM